MVPEVGLEPTVSVTPTDFKSAFLQFIYNANILYCNLLYYQLDILPCGAIVPFSGGSRAY